MSPGPLLAVLASALLHASWNALLKRRADPAASSLAIVALAALVSGALSVATVGLRFPAAAWPWVLGAGLIEALYFVSLSEAMRRLPLATAYGVSRGAGLLFIWPLSVSFFGERLSLLDAVGATLLSLGLLLTSLPRGSVGTWRRGLVAVFVCALAIAAYPLAYKGGLEAGVKPAPLFALSLLISLPAQAALLGPKRRHRLAAVAGDAPWLVGLAGIMCAGSFLLFLSALELEGAGRITALRNTSVIFAALLGRFAGERVDARGWASTLLIAAGAVLLAR